MPPPLDEALRDAILADIRAGQKSAGQIARDHKVSQSTVSRIAQDAGLNDAWDRSKTKNAVQALKIDNQERRASLSNRMLVKAGELLDQMDEPHLVFNIGGKDNVYTEHLLNRPTTGDLRNLMIAAATAIDKHAAIERLEQEQSGHGATSSLLREFVEGIRARRDVRDRAAQEQSE